MKTITLFILPTIFFVSCDNIPEKNKELARKIFKENSLIGNWIAQPSYENDTINLIHIDSLAGKIENIMRFKASGQLDLFDIDGDENLYWCGNTTRYSDESNWKLNPKKGLLFIDIYGGNVEESFHTTKSYKIEKLSPDTIFLTLHRTLTDEKK